MAPGCHAPLLRQSLRSRLRVEFALTRVYKSLENFETLAKKVKKHAKEAKVDFPAVSRLRKRIGKNLLCEMKDQEFMTFTQGGESKNKTVEKTGLNSFLKAMGQTAENALIKDIHSMGNQLESYVDMLLAFIDTSEIDEYFLLLNFWGISNVFCENGYQKAGEFEVFKLAKGRQNDGYCSRYWKKFTTMWQPRWMVVSFNNICYYQTPNDPEESIKDNIPLDSSTNLVLTGYSSRDLRMSISLNRRNMAFKFEGLAEGLYGFFCFIKALCRSYFTKKHFYGSFAPMRTNNEVEFYIRGEKYFSDLRQLLMGAKREIFILDWFFSPQFPLVRPTNSPFNENEDDSKKDPLYPNRIMDLLREAAKRGVYVNIILYDEFDFGLYNDSLPAKKALEEEGIAIKVLRHPLQLIFYWSHHEKMVIVDRKVVMLGGLDIAWGRWDDSNLDLFDYTVDGTMYPGIDYYNPYKKEFRRGHVYNSDKDRLDRKIPRMPWEDVGVQLRGPIVFDYLTHFIFYWDNTLELLSEGDILSSQMILVPYPGNPTPDEIKRLNFFEAAEMDLINRADDFVVDFDKATIYDPYRTALMDYIRNLPSIEEFYFQIDEYSLIENDKVFDTFSHPSKTDGDKNSISDNKPKNSKNLSQKTQKPNSVAITDSELYNFSAFPASVDNQGRVILLLRVGNKSSLQTVPIPSLSRLPSHPSILPHTSLSIPLPPSSPGMIYESMSREWLMREVRDQQIKREYEAEKGGIYKVEGLRDTRGMEVPIVQRTAIDGERTEENKEGSGYSRYSFQAQGSDLSNHSTGSGLDPSQTFSLQALRSASPWSIGLKVKENSVHNCYIEMILSAKRFIFIENQFFVSSYEKTVTKANKDIKNRIAKAIFLRIKRAIKFGEEFKVMIFIPLMPSAEENLDESKGNLLQTIIGYQNFSLAEGEGSLIQKIREYMKDDGDYEKYIMVCGLRKYGFPPSKRVDPKNPKRYLPQNLTEDPDCLPCTELIYIHSKLMIVDDLYLVMGSANINDRSMWGDRDSELACYMAGPENMEIKVSGLAPGRKVQFTVNRQIHEFRVKLMSEHFGLGPDDVAVPFSSYSWSKFWNILKYNTYFYDRCFKVYPSNRYKNWEDFRTARKNPTPQNLFDKEAFIELNPFVKGHAVEYPFNFLVQEKLEDSKNKEFGLSLAPLHTLL